MARPQKQRCICSLPQVAGFGPQGCESSGSINLTYDEYEVIRLLDHMQMTQEQCAQRMQISRPTGYACEWQDSYDRWRRCLCLPGNAAGVCRGRALLS